MATVTDIEALAILVRKAFQRLKALADRLHKDAGMSAGMRAVLESLLEHGPATVPSIARGKRVSRQHIQVLVNALDRKGLIRVEENPSDRRSPLVRPTWAGRAVFRRMRKAEGPLLAELGEALRGRDLKPALDTLAAFNEALEGKLEGEKDDDDA